MKKRFYLPALAMALFGGTGITNANANHANTVNEIKGTTPENKQRQERKIHHAGGLDLMQVGQYGMSPKEYGIRYGHGNSRKHSNRLRFTHNAKLKSRLK